MRHQILFLVVVMNCMFSAFTVAQNRFVTQDEAFSLVQQEFVGQDVDYYILSGRNLPVWKFFVDAEPMKGWQHDCYVLTVPKFTNSNGLILTPTMQYLTVPPSENYVPLLVQNRYGSNSNSKPVVAQNNANGPDNVGDSSIAQSRTYAVILSGGINPLCNYERYWNDCSFIYQTLSKKYLIPKNHIFPLMSDGADPGEDMLTIGGFRSQPLDLDNDGVDEIELAATKENVRNVLNNLRCIMQEDDHLFFYVIDHGGSLDKDKESFICLWDEDSLLDVELADMLEPFTAKYINVNVVLGQCFSGGFVDDLTQVGCVVATASKGNESSWACHDIPYDEFVYQWTSAVNEADHRGNNVNSDMDGNGMVSMDEAFSYANEHDRRNETPMYLSTPESIGEDLAFNHLASAVDLYIKDNLEDTGKEPNTTTDKFWKSPSIWLRNQDDTIFVHENPIFTRDHQSAYIYVRVHNRGKADFDGTGKWIITYWALASTGLEDEVWKGRELYEGKFATGGILEACPIDSMKAGEYKDMCITWALPKLLNYYPDGNFHFCLYAKIMDTPYDDGYVPGQTYFDKRGSNDQAQKNVTIISKKDVQKGFNVYVRNVASSNKSYSLELVPQSNYDASMFSNAKVEVSMTPKIYNAWERGGFQSQDIELPSSQPNAGELQKVKFVSPQSKLQNITLQAKEFDIVNVKFDFTKLSYQSSTYVFDLIQKDEDGNIVGGETFVVESPSVSLPPIQVFQSPSEDGQAQLSVSDTDFVSYKWTDDSGKLLGDSSILVVTPTETECNYTVYAVNHDGDAAKGSIYLEKVDYIKNISIDADNVVVDFSNKVPQGAEIQISSLENGTVVAGCCIPDGESSVRLDGVTLSRGLYAVTYIVHSEISDQKKIKIE